jgi:sigma-B regulation protein RsbU (phosphoserine phosphatase)
MKLRTAILAGITALVAGIIASTVFAVVVVLGRSERSELHEDLGRSRRVFDDLLTNRHSQLRSDCRVVANEPRLRATVATQDITRETVVGVVTELRTSLGSDLFLLTDRAGTLIVDAVDAEAQGFDLSKNDVIAAALAKGSGEGVWIFKERAYQVAGCRIDFGARTIGIIVIGRVFDDAVAATVKGQTGTGLVLALDGKPVASSAVVGDRPIVNKIEGVTANVRDVPTEVDVAGSAYVVLGGALPDYEGKRVLSFAMLRSLDEALAPGRRLTHSILVIAGIALLAAIGLALLLSGRLSRPVAELVAFTRRIGKGQLDERARETGVSEVKALAASMNVMITELNTSRIALAKQERLEREMEIAMRIQTSMLPRSFEVLGLEIAARMIPASEVGGDYYDILPVENGCWIGIGDVAGHGLTAGLEMLMVQSVIAALVRDNPTAAPTNHLRVLNHVIYDNIRNRLGQDEHITLTLLRYQDGKLKFAGAHEEIVVARAAGGRCECISTPGTWLGAIRDIGLVTEDSDIELAKGDLMVLYTDGVTEARGRDGTVFGIEGLCKIVEDNRTLAPDIVRDKIVAAVQSWQVIQDDDISVVVVRRS